MLDVIKYFLHNLKLFFVIFLTLGLVACGGGSAGGGGKAKDTKARFLALAFWQSQARGIERIYYNNDRLLLKKSAVIAFEGDAVEDYQPQINEAIGLLRQNFDLKVQYGYSPNADVNVYLYYGEGSRNASIIKAENRANRIAFDRLGAMQYLDTQANQFKITNQYRPYGANENLQKSPVFAAVCETRFHYNDVNLQAQTFWQRRISLSQVVSGNMTTVSKTPDFSVVLGFMGVPEDVVVAPGQERWAGGMRAKAIQPLAFPCVYEEIVHALTFWRDLPDPDRVAFTGQYQGSPRRHARGYRRDVPELQTMLSYYNLPGMRAGLSYQEVVQILENSQ